MSVCPASLTKSSRAKRRAFLGMLAALSFTNAGRAEVRPSSPFASRIARRYRVEASAVQRVITLAERHFPADPALLLAIVGVESSWRPWALGAVGEVGLCQVRPDMHGASANELVDPAVNIRVAARLLRRCFKRAQGDIAGAVARYNGRGDAAQEYAARVLEERRRLLEPEVAQKPIVTPMLRTG
ncbi:MAG TPA: lytic transglycosylase domain-containing protein [Burkholderiales bacterium]|nr:lytic transglycosylase domain-containing protein [Burkholderiales bacterium]